MVQFLFIAGFMMSVLCFGGSRLTYWCVVGAFVALETGFGWTFDWYVPSTVFIGAKNPYPGTGYRFTQR